MKYYNKFNFKQSIIKQIKLEKQSILIKQKSDYMKAAVVASR